MASGRMLAAIQEGRETEKPGSVGLNFSALMSDQKVDYIIQLVDNLAATAPEYLVSYEVDPGTARYTTINDQSSAVQDNSRQDKT